jgi:hypothetical protein
MSWQYFDILCVSPFTVLILFGIGDIHVYVIIVMITFIQHSQIKLALYCVYIEYI